MHTLDWILVGLFILTLVWITISTNRLTNSVAGFLSSERCAGRYLLTIANVMVGCSTIGIVADFEGYYRNGIAGMWWGLIYIPVGLFFYMTGWVVYRYRETRAMTMAQLLEMRYSKNFRIFAGIVAFLSGLLNCAVFPMVTAQVMIFLFGFPQEFQIASMTIATYPVMVTVLVSIAITLALAGGQIAIMVTDFFQGTIASCAIVGIIFYVLYKLGWTNIIETLGMVDNLKEATVDPLPTVTREAGSSLINPLKQGSISDFNPWFFFLLAFYKAAEVGVWQGGSGYMTAARTPHEARMGTMLGSWRWSAVTLGTIAMVLGVFTLAWSNMPELAEQQESLKTAIAAVEDDSVKSRVFVPLGLTELLPAGLLGLFIIYLLGASISSDNSAYHSWGSIFLQDVVMPFRKKPFPKKKHLFLLRCSVASIGIFAIIFSWIFNIRDFIHMWFQITGAIYLGGASAAIVGGLYWKKGTTQGAWAGMITGCVLAGVGVVIQNFPLKGTTYMKQIGEHFGIDINGQYIAIGAILIAYLAYFLTSLATSKKPFNLEKLLNRGEYAIDEDNSTKRTERTLLERIVGVSKDFSKGDKAVYYTMFLWNFLWILVFAIGTTYCTINKDTISTDQWKNWWAIHLGLLLLQVVICVVWFTVGGFKDIKSLYRILKTKEVDENDDGFVSKTID